MWHFPLNNIEARAYELHYYEFEVLRPTFNG